MPKLSQGDIFAAVAERRADLAIIFGHIGFNYMHLSWCTFRDSVPRLANLRDPFTGIQGRAERIAEGRWLWFVKEGKNHGLTDGQVISALDSALSWATSAGVRSVITNGIADVDGGRDCGRNRISNDRRARLLIQYAAEQEKARGLGIELVSLNSVFTRNSTLSDGLAHLQTPAVSGTKSIGKCRL